MKKKLKQMKRRWRKMHKSDKSFFACVGTITALNIATLPWIHGNVMNILWLTLLLWMRWMYVVSLRKNTKRDFHRGAMHQWRYDRRRCNELSEQLISAEFSRDRLNSQYKKLEYDYRQLKKQSKSNNKTRKS